MNSPKEGRSEIVSKYSEDWWHLAGMREQGRRVRARGYSTSFPHDRVALSEGGGVNKDRLAGETVL